MTSSAEGVAVRIRSKISEKLYLRSSKEQTSHTDILL